MILNGQNGLLPGTHRGRSGISKVPVHSGMVVMTGGVWRDVRLHVSEETLVLRAEVNVVQPTH